MKAQRLHVLYERGRGKAVRPAVLRGLAEQVDEDDRASGEHANADVVDADIGHFAGK